MAVVFIIAMDLALLAAGVWMVVRILQVMGVI